MGESGFTWAVMTTPASWRLQLENTKILPINSIRISISECEQLPLDPFPALQRGEWKDNGIKKGHLPYGVILASPKFLASPIRLFCMPFLAKISLFFYWIFQKNDGSMRATNFFPWKVEVVFRPLNLLRWWHLEQWGKIPEIDRSLHGKKWTFLTNFLPFFWSFWKIFFQHFQKLNFVQRFSQ